MKFRKLRKRHANVSSINYEVYTSVVRSLYDDFATLLVGAISTSIAASILYAKSGDPIHLIFAGLLSLVSIQRMLDAKQFRKHKKNWRPGIIKLMYWENRYLVLGSAYVFLLSSWCYFVTLRDGDDFDLMMTTAITLANLVGITGRNFGSDNVVTAQLVSASVPLISGSILFGDPYHMTLGLFLIPFFFGIKLMTKRLRGIFLSEAVAAIENKQIANRFDIAINNISHGMIMVSRDHEILVANQRFNGLAGLEAGTLVGKSLADVDWNPLTKYGNDHADTTFEAQIRTALDASHPGDFTFYLENGRVIEVRFYPMNEGCVALLEDISERISSSEEIQMLANFDPLTMLPNRRHFMIEMQKLLDVRKSCSVMFVDLDKFKEVNDSLGHPTGDKLLKVMAQRLTSKLGKNDLICRFGGDEFVMCVPNQASKREASRLAHCLIDAITRPLILDGHQIIISASVGISMSSAANKDADRMLKNADAALYKAKTDGRGMHAFYSRKLGQSIRDRRQLELDLRKAIDRDQFEIHFQPLVDLKAHRIKSCEALIRWEHPVHGQISPSKFIPIAEETGFINEIGEYVMEAAMSQCMTWPGDVAVAVNVSSVQFQHSDIHGLVKRLLKRTGLPPSRLEIEVTESALLKDIEDTRNILQKLSGLGVRISLDDFGTGFSSLNYLHSLPLDKVKIDRSFIKNISKDEKSQMLLEGIVRLSHSLGLRVVVEGVERIEQLETLQSKVNVDQVQGFLFGRALPPDALSELLGSGLMLGSKPTFKQPELKKVAVG